MGLLAGSVCVSLTLAVIVCVYVCVCACVLCAVPCVVVTLWATSADSNNLKHIGSELFTTLWQGWFCVSAFYDPDKKLSVLVNSTLNHTQTHTHTHTVHTHTRVQ